MILPRKIPAVKNHIHIYIQIFKQCFLRYSFNIKCCNLPKRVSYYNRLKGLDSHGNSYATFIIKNCSVLIKVKQNIKFSKLKYIDFFFNKYLRFLGIAEG